LGAVGKQPCQVAVPSLRPWLDPNVFQLIGKSFGWEQEQSAIESSGHYPAFAVTAEWFGQRHPVVLFQRMIVSAYKHIPNVNLPINTI